MAVVDLPGGTRVWARGLDGPAPEPPPDIGLYLDPRWDTPWPSTTLDWPDLGVPRDWESSARAIREAFEAAEDGQRVEVGCGAGLGRTGTVLACMATLAGVPGPENATEYVRSNYSPDAIENSAQERWVTWFASLEPFVGYLCLTYHEARNVRHLIKDGRLDPQPYEPLRQLPRNREAAWAEIQSLRRLALVTGSPSSGKHVFEEHFGLTLADLEILYGNEHWKGDARGGNRWASVTSSLIDLHQALSDLAVETGRELIREIGAMRHNTGTVASKLERLDGWLRDDP